MTLNEIKNRVIDVLTNNKGTMVNRQAISDDWTELRRRMIEVLTDKHGELKIPLDEIEALADALLPGLIAFFSSEEGKAEFEAWKKEQEEQKKEKENKTA